MYRFAYSLLTYLLLPLGLLRLARRARATPAYRRRWRERLGWYADAAPVDARPCVIFHAVSVGEVHAAQPLIERFLSEHAGHRVVVTTATPTGAERVEKLFGARVTHVYLPWDLPGATYRFLRRFRPALLVLLETELWPNLLHACRRGGCRVLLVNARLSDKSFRNYRRFAGLTRQVLDGIDLVAAQAHADGERFVALGLDARRLRVTGSLKFDVAVDTARVEEARRLRESWPARPVWIAASTREGEDAIVLDAFRRLLERVPDVLLLLVPRHPERFREAGDRARGQGLVTAFFSENTAPDRMIQVLVGDTMGDMALYYSLADVAFVGGSLVPTGCQNIIEPAALGLPVLTGPSLFNFQKVSELLRGAGAQRVVHDAGELAEAVADLLADADARRVMAQAARAEVARNRGAGERLASLVNEALMPVYSGP